MKDIEAEGDEELSTPLIEATVIDEEEDNSPVMAKPTPKKQIETVRVKVTAPASLPPGYAIQVLYQEQDENNNPKDVWKKGVVQVPLDGEGVQKGDVFEAETKPYDNVKQARGYWLGGEFEPRVCCCSPTTDTDFCLLAWCCTPVAWACLLERLVELEEQNMGKKRKYRPQFVAKSIGGLSLLFLILYLISMLSGTVTTKSKGAGDSTPSTLFAIVFVVFGMIARAKVRAHYNIRSDNACYDCMCVTFCSKCSVLQSYYQMKKAHEHPHLGYIPNEPLPAEAEKLV